MKIEVKIPDSMLESTAEGLKGLARRMNPRFSSSKKGKEFIEEFLNDLVKGAHVTYQARVRTAPVNKQFQQEESEAFEKGK